MRTNSKVLGAAVGIAAGLAACAWGQSRVSADDSRLTVTPAVQRVTESSNSGASVQFVQWARPYGYRGYYGPSYGRAYNAPYYRPYYGAYYGYPTYGGYGYTYPAYGYAYPAYGYPAYGGIGVRAGGVGVGIW